MSEEKKKRTVDEIRSEYGRICTQAGHIQYQMSALETDLSLLNEQLKQLNFEASIAIKEEAPPASVDPVSAPGETL